MQTFANLAGAVLRLSLWLTILAAVFVPLERAFALRPGKVWRAGIVTDLGYYFLSNLLPALLLALPIALIGATVQRLAPPGWLGWTAALPVWTHLALALVVGEIGAYWGHRLTHRVPLLWRFHVIHHSPEHVDWLVHSRAHPVDMVFVRLCGLVPIFAVGLAQPTGLGVKVAAVAQIISTFWGFLIHANLRWRFGALEQLLATPLFHHWHHTRHAPLDRNFAAMFPWVDRLFGTLHLPAEWPSAYGTDTPVPAQMPAQLFAPLRPRQRVRASPTAARTAGR